jgi:hypothetical protein
MDMNKTMGTTTGIEFQSFVADAEAGREFYHAVIRNREWLVVANCQHRHGSREAAEECATRLLRWMRRAEWKVR